jgi:hypothetical protein
MDSITVAKLRLGDFKQGGREPARGPAAMEPSAATAHQVTTTDFQTRLAENHRAAALRFVLHKCPCLKNAS